MKLINYRKVGSPFRFFEDGSIVDSTDRFDGNLLMTVLWKISKYEYEIFLEQKMHKEILDK